MRLFLSMPEEMQQFEINNRYNLRKACYIRYRDVLVKDTLVMDVLVTDILVSGHFGNRTS